MTTIELPDVVAHEDGYVTTTLIAKPFYVYAWRTTVLDTGRTWLSVYRSVLIRDDDHERLEPVRPLIGDRELLRREVIEDESMMFNEAKLSVYGKVAV